MFPQLRKSINDSHLIHQFLDGLRRSVLSRCEVYPAVCRIIFIFDISTFRHFVNELGLQRCQLGFSFVLPLIYSSH
jgi:hypothetical protein